MKANAKDTFEPSGKYTVLHLSRDLQSHEIEQARRYSRGDVSARAGLPITHEQVATNIVPINGKNVIARILAGDLTYTGIINYGAFGSGTAAFSSTSSQLNTEVFRKIPSGAASDSNISYIDWFIATADVANQTFPEFGAFTASSGRAMSLLLTGGWVKSGAMFITLAITIS